MKKILIIKTSSLGDIIHTLPAISDLSTWFPEAQIDWVAEEAFQQIPRWHNATNQVIPIAIRRWRKNLLCKQTYYEWRYFKHTLKKTQYDLIIDAQGLFKSAFFIGRIANSTNKQSFDKKTIREPIARWFYHQGHNVDTQQHAINRIKLLAAKVCNKQPLNTPADFGIQHSFNQNLSASPPYLVALTMSARLEKQWPEAHWRRLFQYFNLRNIQIKIPWYTAAEQAQAQRLAQNFPNVEVMPPLTITQTAQVIANSHSCVSVDTGFSHVAAALNIPNITLYGPTQPHLIGTYGQTQIHIQSPTNSMAELTPGAVIRQLPVLLKQKNLQYCY